MSFKQYILTNKKRIQQILYPSSLASIIGLIITIYSLYKDKFVAVNLFLLITAVLIVTATVIFLYVEKLSLNERTPLIFAPTQNHLEKEIKSIEEFLHDSEDIVLLGGTFKSFTDKEENLNKIAGKLASNSKIRILMLDPHGIGAQNVTKARQERNNYFSVDKIPNEIKSSLERIGSKIGIENMCKIVRLYSFAPTCSIYRFDNKYILTTYLQGRGASSPAMYFELNPNNHHYCKSINNGLDELWDSKSTKTIDMQYLKTIGIL